MVGAQRLKVCDNWAQLCSVGRRVGTDAASAPFCSSGGAISASAQELLARLTAPAHYTAIDERAAQPQPADLHSKKRQKIYNFPPLHSCAPAFQEVDGKGPNRSAFFYANNKLLMKAVRL